MCQLKISDLSFCEVVTQKEIEVKGGLTIANLATNNGTVPLLSSRLSPLTSELDNLSNLSLNVEPVTTQDGSTVEKLENPSAGISGFRVRSQDGTTNITTLTGSNFKFASASARQSSS